MANKRIQRSVCAEVCDWWANNGSPPQQQTSSYPDLSGLEFMCVNTDQYSVFPGDFLFVWGFYPRSISYANAYKKALNNKIKLEVKHTPWKGDHALSPLVAITGARQGHICRAKSAAGNLYIGNIYYQRDPDTGDLAVYQYINEQGVSIAYAEEAYGQILHTSALGIGAYSQYSICLCETFGKAQQLDVEVPDASSLTLSLSWS